MWIELAPVHQLLTWCTGAKKHRCTPTSVQATLNPPNALSCSGSASTPLSDKVQLTTSHQTSSHSSHTSRTRPLRGGTKRVTSPRISYRRLEKAPTKTCVSFTQGTALSTTSLTTYLPDPQIVQPINHLSTQLPTSRLHSPLPPSQEISIKMGSLPPPIILGRSPATEQKHPVSPKKPLSSLTLTLRPTLRLLPGRPQILIPPLPRRLPTVCLTFNSVARVLNPYRVYWTGNIY